MERIFYDTLMLDGVRRTGDGFLIAEAKVARSGIQVYRGIEVDPDNEHGFRDRATVRVYRPSEEVFAADSLKTFAFRPVTIDHPAKPVTADSWKTHSVGIVGNDIVRDGEFVRVPLVIMDADAIQTVENNEKRQISMGYVSELHFGDGETADGQKYEVTQRKMRMNHLAIVRAARGGSELKIGDTQQTESKGMARTIMVDGLSVNVADDQSASIVEREISRAAKRANDAETQLANVTESNAKLIAAKDAEIAKRDAQIADLQSKVLDAASLDKRVAERADLVAKAKSIAPTLKLDGMADADIRKAVVVAKFGDEMASKSAAYLDARFDMLCEDSMSGAAGGAPDKARLAIVHSAPVGDSAEKVMNDAHAAMIARLNPKAAKAS